MQLQLYFKLHFLSLSEYFIGFRVTYIIFFFVYLRLFYELYNQLVLLIYILVSWWIKVLVSRTLMFMYWWIYVRTKCTVALYVWISIRNIYIELCYLLNYTIVYVCIYSRKDIYVCVFCILACQNHRKKGQNEEKPLFSNPVPVGLIKVQTLMNNDECAWTNACGAFHGFPGFDNLLSSQDPLLVRVLQLIHNFTYILKLIIW